MNIKDFKPGQQVYVVTTKHISTGGKAEIQRIEEWKIISVGRKYIKAGKELSNGEIYNEVVFEFDDSVNQFVEKTVDCFLTRYLCTLSEIGEVTQKWAINKAIELIELSGDFKVIHVMKPSLENDIARILVVDEAEIYVFYVRLLDSGKGFEIRESRVALLTDPATPFDSYEWSELEDK